jgi:predicted MFS family arabinose efflux permease
MTRYGHIGWRVAAVVVAFVGTAVLAVALTHTPDSPQAAGPSAVCPTSGLQAWLGLGAVGTAEKAATGTEGTGTEGCP